MERHREMEAVAEGLWGLAEEHERWGDVTAAVKCLEAIVQSHVSFLPIVEVKTRLRIASLLLSHSHNLSHAKSHLERSQLLLKTIPSCFELKCRAYSLLSQCYQVVGAIPPQKQIVNKALELVSSSGDGYPAKLWSCNFNSQLACALMIEGDYRNSISALENGYMCATDMLHPELQMFFATSMLHVHLMQWDDESSVERAAERCNEVWELIQPDQRQHCLGLFFYNELLHTFYRLRICDYKKASQHVERLDAAMKDDLQRGQHIQELTAQLDFIHQRLAQFDLHHNERSALYSQQVELQNQLRAINGLNYSSNSQASMYKLLLAPPPIDGEWLPKSAVFALIDLMAVIVGRPKGVFKEGVRRLQSGLHVIEEELAKLGIREGMRESDIQRSDIWTAGVYLMLLMHFLENKITIELTRSEFVEAQKMKDWYARFPTMLQGCDCVIEMLRGHYSHSLACFDEATFHFIEASKLTESRSIQSMCHVYAAVSYICIGDAESSSKAMDLVGPVYKIMDSFVGVREKTCVIFAYGLLLTKQHNLQEARRNFANGLRVAHQQLGNIQLVSQYLTILGALALALHDTVQAGEILRSSLTLAKTLYDVPTQVWVLSVFGDLYREMNEKANELENSEYERKKEDDLQKRLLDAQSTVWHLELVDKVRIEAQPPHVMDLKRATAGPSKVDLDIPESIGLPNQPPAPLSRLREVDYGRSGKRKL
ncbi:hypothetical protein QJS10_CPB21g01774 [Acorus calamus]|uniref:Sister chromatid cohesion protein SCC4 n=1 Tax=Acorus calamus TaxID=4465 RepID=A0AAV9C331_ACOCL|nr:hypothetical protein QJS10_CPB21g01774 [Acorus calamus]